VKPSQTVGNMQVTPSNVACFYYIQNGVKINSITKLKIVSVTWGLGELDGSPIRGAVRLAVGQNFGNAVHRG